MATRIIAVIGIDSKTNPELFHDPINYSYSFLAEFRYPSDSMRFRAMMGEGCVILLKNANTDGKWYQFDPDPKLFEDAPTLTHQIEGLPNGNTD